VRNNKRTYIGEVLDLYKTASGNRYGSVKTAGTVAELQYLSVRVYLPLIAVRHRSPLYIRSRLILWLSVIVQQHSQ
jgi:hypothetical protein